MERAEERGFHISELLAAAADPEVVLPGKEGRSTLRHIRGRVMVAVDPFKFTIVTVSWPPGVLPDERVPAHKAPALPEPPPMARAATAAIEASAPAPETPAPETPAPVMTTIRDKKFRGLQERLARGRHLTSRVTETPPEWPAASSRPTQEQLPIPASPRREQPVAPAPILRAIRQQVLPQLRQRPGHWATVDCNVPGVASMLRAEPGIDLEVDVYGAIRVRYTESAS